jgi:hypothetical protein
MTRLGAGGVDDQLFWFQIGNRFLHDCPKKVVHVNGWGRLSKLSSG